MDAQSFRERVIDVGSRVAERTGVDPLDVSRSSAIVTDARIELLPRSIGIGLAAMAFAITVVCIRFLLEPATGPGYTVTWAFVVVDVLIAGGVAACVVLARAARGRRMSHLLYEDAWAKFAVEVWPAQRYRSRVGAAAASARSRTEFLRAVRDGSPLDAFEHSAPFTRMP